jgi:(S)-mandelate dehydrogenase
MVFIGRAAVYGLAAGGEAGVRRALQLLRAEIDRVLALLGCPSIDALGTQYLRTTLKEPAVVRPFPIGRARSA